MVEDVHVQSRELVSNNAHLHDELWWHRIEVEVRLDLRVVAVLVRGCFTGFSRLGYDAEEDPSVDGQREHPEAIDIPVEDQSTGLRVAPSHPDEA